MTPVQKRYFVYEMKKMCNALSGNRISYSLRPRKSDPINRIYYDIGIDVIKQIVSEVTRVPVDLICAPYNYPGAKKSEVVVARNLAVYFSLLHLETFSKKQIGLNFGGRDHSTVIYAENIMNDILNPNHHKTTYENTILKLYSKIEAAIMEKCRAFNLSE